MENFNNEIWKDIKGYEGKYQISNYGRVKSLNYRNTHKEKILTSFDNGNGYLHIGLRNGNIKKDQRYIHRLVAETFINNPDNLPCVNHKDENKQNNFVWINDDGSVDFDKSNLEWCSYKYNLQYSDVIMKGIKSARKPINQYTLDGKLIKCWDSSAHIQNSTKYKATTISNCCHNRLKTAYGYIWKFAK